MIDATATDLRRLSLLFFLGVSFLLRTMKDRDLSWMLSERKYSTKNIDERVGKVTRGSIKVGNNGPGPGAGAGGGRKFSRSRATRVSDVGFFKNVFELVLSVGISTVSFKV